MIGSIRALLAPVVLVACVAIFSPAGVGAQADDAADGIALSFAAYLERVEASNLDAAAARLALPVAEAGVSAARVRPNPNLTAGLGQADISGEGAPTASYVGVSVPIELGGDRRHRVAVAEAMSARTRAEVDVVIGDVRTRAAIAFVDALEAELLLELRRQSLEAIEHVVEVNLRRFEHGDIGEITYIQSRVEAQRFRADLLLAQGDVRAANVALAVYASGNGHAAISIAPEGDLRLAPRTLDEAALVDLARASRPELVAREQDVVRSQRLLDVARAQRIVDVTLGIGWTHYGATDEPQFMQRPNDLLSVQLTLPLPFSNRHRGNLDIARGTIAESEMRLDAERLRVAVEVRRAVAHYRAAVERMALYDDALLAGADDVLSRFVVEYQRGGSTLLELLNAQRTANEVHVGHIGALADHVRALIRLESAIGTWNIDL